MLVYALFACSAPPAPANAESPAPTPVAAPAEPVAPVPVAPAPPAVDPDFPDAPALIACEEAPAGMACVPGGATIRGSDEPHACDQQKYQLPDKPNYAPAAKVWVQTVYMDLTEVTYEAFKSCVKSGACKVDGGPAYNDFNRPTQPIVGVSWYAADKFCKAQGKHLPTEAQWEMAARGHDGEHYPWGEAAPTCELTVVMDELGRRSCGVEKAVSHPEKGRTMEVGSRPAARYGLFDMAGNAEEWTADWYSRNYAECGADCLGIEPDGPCAGKATCEGHENKVVKGGSWYWNASHVTGFHRRPHVPANSPTFHHFGFRCAATPDEAAAIRAKAAAAPVVPPAPAAPAP